MRKLFLVQALLCAGFVIGLSQIKEIPVQKFERIEKRILKSKNSCIPAGRELNTYVHLILAKLIISDSTLKLIPHYRNRQKGILTKRLLNTNSLIIQGSHVIALFADNVIYCGPYRQRLLDYILQRNLQQIIMPYGVTLGYYIALDQNKDYIILFDNGNEILQMNHSDLVSDKLKWNL